MHTTMNGDNRHIMKVRAELTQMTNPKLVQKPFLKSWYYVTRHCHEIFLRAQMQDLNVWVRDFKTRNQLKANVVVQLAYVSGYYF